MLWPSRDHDLCGDKCAVATRFGDAADWCSVSGAALFVLDSWLRPVPARVTGVVHCQVQASVMVLVRQG